MLESLFTTTTSTSIDLSTVFITIVIAVVVGLIISLTYMRTHPNGNYSENFALTLILLPTVIAIIILLIGSDVAKAFSLAGAFSIIRFRSEPGEPKDIAYILFSMAAGLAAGAGEFLYALIFTVVLCAGMYILDRIHFGHKKRQSRELHISVPEDLDYEQAFEQVFEQYHVLAKLDRVKTSNLGSLYQLLYSVELPKDIKTKDFIDALRVRNGNLNITLSFAEGKNQ